MKKENKGDEEIRLERDRYKILSIHYERVAQRAEKEVLRLRNKIMEIKEKLDKIRLYIYST